MPHVPANRDVHTLHRYFIWADQMRRSLHQHLQAQGPPPPDEAYLLPWMPYWYGALFVVAEGWREVGLHDEEIDGLLDDPALDLLRLFRNGVFHFQLQYHDQRFLGFLREGEETAQWVNNLHEAFSRWFLGFWAVWQARQAYQAGQEQPP